MAFYGKLRTTKNNVERRLASTSMAVTGIASAAYDLRDSDTNQSKPQVNIADGDVILAGQLPANSSTNKLTILVHEAFPAGTTIDLELVSDDVDGATALLTIATGVVVTESNVAIQVPLPAGGCRDVAGDPLTAGDFASTLWSGEAVPHFVAVTVNGGSLDGSGIIDMNFNYDSFETGTGSYTG